MTFWQTESMVYAHNAAQKHGRDSWASLCVSTAHPKGSTATLARFSLFSMMFPYSGNRKPQTTVQTLEKVLKVLLIPFHAQENTTSLMWMLVSMKVTHQKPMHANCPIGKFFPQICSVRMYLLLCQLGTSAPALSPGWLRDAEPRLPQLSAQCTESGIMTALGVRAEPALTEATQTAGETIPVRGRNELLSEHQHDHVLLRK